MTDEIATLIAKYDRNVPRYTSYPTANHFSEVVGASQQREWLDAVPAHAPLSLYLHIPFCKALCRYCGCHTRVTPAYDSAQSYAQSLIREIEMLAQALGTPRTAAHIHWGGGTPTFLNDRDIGAIFDALRRSFLVHAGCEIAMEIDPRTLSPGRAQFLATQGVNRVSLGVQDFDPGVQQAIARIQPFEIVQRSVDSLRAAGIGQINFDLIYGLPGQTSGTMEATMSQAISLGPERLAVFGYAHVPWFKPQQKILERYDIPDASRRFALAALASARLEEAGYVAIGIDHFARPEDSLVAARMAGTLHRNFQGYTPDSSPVLLGLGASSISALPQGYVQNDPRIESYCSAVDSGGFAGRRGIALTEDDRLRAEFIEKLMCYLSADLGRAGFGDDPQIADRLADFENDGLIVRRGSELEITTKGRPFARAVCTVFDAWYDSGATRHARAV